MNSSSLSVIIPCKNEGESILKVIIEIQQTLDNSKIKYEIVVVNNNSTDNTAFEAMKAGAAVRVVDCKTMGYGASILEGVRTATHDTVCMLDGDGSYNPKDIPTLLMMFNSDTNTSLCLGNRFLNGDSNNIKFLHRIFGVPMLNFITNFLYNSAQSLDSHCGLRVFRKDLIHKLNLTHNGFSFANEMICKALKNKLVIQQLPITLRKDLRINDTSKIKMFSDGFDALKTILQIRF